MKLYKKFLLVAALVAITFPSNIVLFAKENKVEAQQISTQERIARQAETYANGYPGGECKVFVKRVLVDIGIDLGSGYYEAYANIAAPVSAAEAQRGDLIQITDRDTPETGSPGNLHSAIITQRNSDGSFEVIHSNYGRRGEVSRDTFVVENDLRGRSNAQIYFWRVTSESQPTQVVYDNTTQGIFNRRRSWAPQIGTLEINKMQGNKYEIKSTFMWTDTSGFVTPHTRYEHQIAIENPDLFRCINYNSYTARAAQLYGQYTRFREEQLRMPLEECLQGSMETNLPGAVLDTRLFDTENDFEIYGIVTDAVPQTFVNYQVKFFVELTHADSMSPIGVFGSIGHRAESISEPFDYSGFTYQQEDDFCNRWYTSWINETARCSFRSLGLFEDQRLLGVSEYNPMFNYSGRWNYAIGNEGVGVTPSPAAPSQPPISSGDNATFITDVNYPDGTAVGPSQSITKTWRMRNSGRTTWTTDYKLKFQSGSQMGTIREVNLPHNVAPGEEVDISVNLTTPGRFGTSRGYWKLSKANGQFFGDIVWVDLNVAAGVTNPAFSQARVKLFSQANFHGDAALVMNDDSNQAQAISSFGVGQTNEPAADSFSMEIPNGWSVRTFRNDGFSGEERCWTDSQANLQDHGWHNAIQSMIVYNYNYCGGNQKVKLYERVNFDGLLLEKGPGTTNDPARNSYSMEVPAGWSVKTYDQDNKAGGSRCWNTSISNFQDHENWQLRVESMEVFTYNTCPSNEEFVRICRDTGGTNCMDVKEDIPNLGDQGFGNDSVRSIMMSGPYEVYLFEDNDFQGTRFLYRDSNNDIRNAPPNGADHINEYGTTSLRIRKYRPEVVKLYSLGDLNGETFATDRTLEDLQLWGFGDRAQSIRVANGYEVIVCEDAGFRGSCGRLRGNGEDGIARDIAELGPNLRDGASSIRICEGSCPPGANAPTPISQVENAIVQPGAVSVSWTPTGTNYRVQVFGGDLPSPIVSDWVFEPTYTFANLPPSVNPYYYQVQAGNEWGSGGWSNPASFVVEDVPPTELSIVGINEGVTHVPYLFIASSGPVDAQNLNYDWTDENLAGEFGNIANYNWTNTGEFEIGLNATNTGGSITDEHSVTIRRNNAPEVLRPIPDQRIPIGTQFTTLDLGAHIWDEDLGDRVTYSLTGNTNIVLTMVDGVVTPTYPDGWRGRETVNFTATDLAGNTITEQVIFSVGTSLNCNINEFEREFFNNRNLTGSPIPGGCEANIDHDWGLRSPQSGVRADNFSGRWFGDFEFQGGDYTFYANGDNGFRLYVDNELVINNWGTPAGLDTHVVRNLTPGFHSVIVEFYEGTLGASLEVEWRNASQLCTNFQNQFCVKYFDNRNLRGAPVAVNHEAEIEHNWGVNPPAEGVPVDKFSAIWEGNFDFEEREYIFNTVSDDGMRVYVDGVLIMNDWNDHSIRANAIYRNMTAGSHHIKVEYYDHIRTAVAKVDWF